jgi:putative ABC transport system permease protein
VGLLVSLLFALVPLLEVRHVKPLLLLRADTMHSARRRDWRSALTWVAMLGALMAIAIWQADSITAGLYVSGSLAVVTMLLLGASQALVRLTRPLTRSPRFAIRHAVISLGRPGNQTRVILLAVGLGCFFILGVRAVQSNLLAEFDAQLGGDQPDLILIDIQRDQADGVQTLVAPFTRSAPRLLPLMRGRVAGVDGQHLRLPTAADVRRDGRMTREYGMTHRDGLEANERVVAGRFWSGPAGPGDLEAGIDTEVSVEREMRDDTGIALGDLMRFDVAGQILTARVTSVRAVQWDDTQSGGFVFVLRPSPAVAAAPGSFVGFLNLADGTARGTLQRDLVMAYPNVSAIDLREVLASIRDVVEDVTLGVTVVGAVTLVGIVYGVNSGG